jgi:hypothetical protein
MLKIAATAFCRQSMGRNVLDLTWEVLKHYATEFGVVAALVVLALLAKFGAWVLTRVFSKHRVSGQWETQLDRGSGLQKHEDAVLNQFIHHVWGTSIDQARTKYSLRGNIIGDRLRMVYRAKGPGTDDGAILLKVMVSGREMIGFEIGVNQADNEFYSNTYKWTRKP